MVYTPTEVCHVWKNLLTLKFCDEMDLFDCKFNFSKL